MGRHARPSRAGKVAEQAVRITPAVAVAGTMLGTPHHPPSPPRTIPAELAGSVQTPVPHRPAPEPASPSQVYVVRDGDTLWSIAQRFYGDGFMWPQIYDANKSQIHDPNEIYQGQKLTIPGKAAKAPRMAQRSAPQTAQSPAPQAKSAVPVSQIPGVPATAAYYIQKAANATGLPVRMVAAQNYVESSYGENMGPSVAGAMGPWQFEPYTWPSYSSAPFSEATSWPVSTQAYIAMMKYLLHWSHGNVQMALAAYNAGQRNWQAGLGYADEIVSLAGQG